MGLGLRLSTSHTLGLLGYRLRVATESYAALLGPGGGMHCNECPFSLTDVDQSIDKLTTGQAIDERWFIRADNRVT